MTQEVIEDQIEAGLDLVTDGQIRWDDGQTYFARGISGYTINGLIRYFDSNTYYRHPIPEQRLQPNGGITVKDYEFAAAHSERPVKAVITGPYTLARLSQLGCYEDLRSLVMDLAGILNREALALQEAGAPVIQLDEPSILKHKDDADLFAEAIECALDGITATKALCTYFGDASGIHQRLFGLPVDLVGLDFVMGPGNFDLIADLPDGKMLGWHRGRPQHQAGDGGGDRRDYPASGRVGTDGEATRQPKLRAGLPAAAKRQSQAGAPGRGRPTGPGECIMSNGLLTTAVGSYPQAGLHHTRQGRFQRGQIDAAGAYGAGEAGNRSLDHPPG